MLIIVHGKEYTFHYSIGLSTWVLKIAQNPDWKDVATYMVSDEFDSTLDSYLTLNEMKLNDGVKILIHKAYKVKTPGKLAPYFNYAELLTFNQIFDNAIIEYDSIEKSNLFSDPEDIENVSYYYAWALWKSGQKERSLEKWQKLEESESFQYKSASAYFQGKYYYDLDDKTKAKEYFGRVQKQANKSKYATMAWNYYNRIK